MPLDAIAIRIDGPRACDENLTVDLVLTDENTRHRLTLHNGALTHRTTALATLSYVTEPDKAFPIGTP
ncbi:MULTISPECIES: alkyl sulfatase C-terminal domain-containing protein [unclassified Streptomyces]|uniref:alkyl sulfatase C-terminal domain-containing protein n=1 Tax=unclassified Streptomyces TaxID=2593676 RepID=UPI002E19DCBE